MATSLSSPEGNGINFICFVFYGAGGNDGNVETSILSHEGGREEWTHDWVRVLRGVELSLERH